ncbi:hypothetical protein GP486_006641 [Trichoglossum hirsutum]|uniref:Transmembrane protein n=1 Tax=Trichoglossum hirsutum TaxID=265104 RepID=A0A9P8IGZ9_9PEZI|nr:hypothetical protein GP486_006641 [Trichoglossum hirsutum]
MGVQFAEEMAGRSSDITLDGGDDITTTNQPIRNGEVVAQRPLWDSTDLEPSSTNPRESVVVEGVGGGAPSHDGLDADSTPRQIPPTSRDTSPLRIPPPTTTTSNLNRLNRLHRSVIPGVSVITTCSVGVGVGVGYCRGSRGGLIAAICLIIFSNACFLFGRWVWRMKKVRGGPRVCEEGRAGEDEAREGEESPQQK